MLCYKDRTFCDFYEDCKNEPRCDSQLTDKIKKEASERGLPVSRFASHPHCFEQKENSNE